MQEKILSPLFLTQGIAELATNTVLDAVLNGPTSGLVKRQECCIVILAPDMKVSDELEYPMKYTLEYHVLHERHVGDPKLWEKKYDDIARCKALQLLHGRNDGRTGVMPHLLYFGDAPYWGGVNREGIVVACSGLQACLDRAVSGMIADLAIGLAENAWMNSEGRQKGRPFLEHPR